MNLGDIRLTHHLEVGGSSGQFSDGIVGHHVPRSLVMSILWISLQEEPCWTLNSSCSRTSAALMDLHQTRLEAEFDEAPESWDQLAGFAVGNHVGQTLD